MKLSSEDREVIVRRKKEGSSTRAIALDFGISPPAIRRVLRPLGLVSSRSPFEIDSVFFSSVCDEARAYWLGFLLADGHIARTKTGLVLRVMLQERDLPHLRKLASCLKFTGPVRVEERFDRWHGRTTRKAVISVCSTPLCRDLERLGFSLLKREGSTSILDSVHPSLSRHLVRGLIDGDGSISFQRKDRRDYSVSFCDSHEPVVYWVVKYLSEAVSTKLHKAIQKVGKNCYSIIYGSNGQVRRILDHLYGGCSPHSVLERKFSRYLLMMEDLNARTA